MSKSSEDDDVGVRWPELGVAVLLLLVAVMVITDSIRVGTGWADDGPRAGYFPFYIGVALFGASAWIAIQQLLNWRRNGPFAERAQLKLVWAILWPMVVFAGVMATMGIYVAAVVLIGYFMIRHGKHGVPYAAAVSLGVPLVCYLTFERWFLVPLPKGPIEALLGL
jgi:putative tricarboxylic transport membrane protein